MARMKWKEMALLAAALVAAAPALACTRAVYLGDNGDVITARSMDWKVDVATNLYVLPRGIARTGQAGPKSLAWTARYGSVVATGYDVSTTDGMNEKGLVANLLWLVESEYPQQRGNKPGLAISLWAQYVLDNFATVDEAVAALKREPYSIVTDKVPGEDRQATLHLSLSDATGDSAIVEYIGGRQVIHHDRRYQVMTNSPIFEQQLALNSYWQQIGGTVMLPGTNRSSDRFARASFYINAIPKAEDPVEALASVFSVIRWRTVADHKRRLYFFESALTPNTFWVDLNKVDFGGQVLKLDLGKDQRNTFAGDALGHFVPSAPFTFLGVDG
jgi:choloylglycine hydrolase